MIKDANQQKTPRSPWPDGNQDEGCGSPSNAPSRIGITTELLVAEQDADAAGKESSCLRTRLAEMSLRSSPDPSVFRSIK
ncbi:hypothetical protein SAY87_025168 [Trapa incisa]|uniref:Uncharacterized protein n=1 Tax=Trapa incisa TaxID=236973 RepID=A0AAN7JGC1_9MYRT|nr:hypothetical protein SAY87_025168 [Trapa incisa]